MLPFLMGSALAAILGFVLAKRLNLVYILKWISIEVRFNVLAVKAIAHDRFQARYNHTELPEMPGKIAIVTGGSRGMGVEVVRMLLQCHMEVIIACRRIPAGEKAIKNIRKSGITSGKAIVMELDNSSLSSIKKFVDEFTKNYEKLDILINNAGVMFTPYRETVDGFEEQYGVNYLSHFLLTVSLIPLLQKAGTSKYYSRIVNVTSCAHLLGEINFDDINLKDNFLTNRAYAQSKLAQVLFTKYLARFFVEKKQFISVNAVHPGIVNTDLFVNSHVKYFKVFGGFIFKTVQEGATSIAYLAISRKMENKTGLYFSNCLETSVNVLVYDKELQDRFFDFSLKQVKLQSIIT